MLNPPKKKQISTVMDKHLASPVSTLPSSSDQGFDSPAPSEILKGVVAYVEVRTANDNRSAAVKWVLERMGAKVEEKFSDDVTHVIFKEGKKRTLDKAQKLGVHLVSVLWVDSCKEKQQRVSEHEFSANTKHCGTPPPGIRWKKYKSMQPRDFEDELARSADRCQKRQRKNDKYWQLLQGEESATPLHSTAHVLVVDTQPRSPFASLDLYSPVIIPGTPPSMQARLNQLIQEKEAKKLGEPGGSPVNTSLNLDLPPLQRTLFKNQSPETDKTPVLSQRSSRSSGCISKNCSSRSLPKMLRNAESSDHNKTHGNLQRAQADNPDLSRPASENAVHEKRGRKRKSCLVDAIFPSSLPAPKRGRGSSQIKENQCKRISLIPSDAVEQLSSKSSSKGRKKGVGNRRKTLVKNKGNESVSSLCSTSSILGSSLSMVFNGISRTSQSKLGPSRNSLAEFKVAKPQCQGKQVSLSRDQSSQDVERDVKKMCLLKFHLAGVPSLVMTSLHREEQDFVIGAVKRLGVFRIEDKVSKHTTHVVCGEARRTLNVLNGLARGCWLISKEWVERSMEDGSWTCEEGYEMVEDFPKSKEARLAREAEEPGAYRCRIFEPVGFIFVSNICTPPRAQLIRLLQLCGAKVTDSIHRADFYIGDSAHDEKNSVKPVWVLDSISQMELLPMDDYILAINHKAKSSSSPEF